MVLNDLKINQKVILFEANGTEVDIICAHGVDNIYYSLAVLFT